MQSKLKPGKHRDKVGQVKATRHKGRYKKSVRFKLKLTLVNWYTPYIKYITLGTFRYIEYIILNTYSCTLSWIRTLQTFSLRKTDGEHTKSIIIYLTTLPSAHIVGKNVSWDIFLDTFMYMEYIILDTFRYIEYIQVPRVHDTGYF